MLADLASQHVDAVADQVGGALALVPGARAISFVDITSTNADSAPKLVLGRNTVSGNGVAILEVAR